MFPLIFARESDNLIVKKIISNDKKRLEELGFIKDTIITLIFKNNDNIIVKLKETRIAISSTVASTIYVDQYVNEIPKVKQLRME